jgi:undecaprenyl-diphosphatase
VHELIKIVASYFIIIPVVGALYMLLVVKQRRRLELLASLVLGGVLSLLLAKLASHLYNDPRPFVQGHFTPLLPHSNDNGFPSDHTLLAAFVGWTILYYSRRAGIVLLLVAGFIGAARMAGGIHHLSDVLGSFVLAAIGSGVAMVVVRWAADRYAGKRAATSTKI